VIAEYRGLKVLEITALRKKLRAIDAEIRVVKNTLIGGSGGDAVRGLSGISRAYGGGVRARRSRRDGESDEGVRGRQSQGDAARGVRGGEGSLREGCRNPRSVPSREVLLSRSVGGLASPITRLAQAFSGPPANCVRPRVIRKQKPRKRSQAEPEPTKSQNL